MHVDLAGKQGIIELMAQPADDVVVGANVTTLTLPPCPAELLGRRKSKKAPSGPHMGMLVRFYMWRAASICCRRRAMAE